MTHNSAAWLRLLLLEGAHYREPFTEGRSAINGLGHALQTATRAERDGAPAEQVLMALLHDAMRPLTDIRHGEAIAEVMAGRLSPDCCEVLRHHGEFGADTVHGRTETLWRYGPRSWFPLAVQLAEWDAAAYAPQYPSHRLDHFLPLLEEICA